VRHSADPFDDLDRAHLIRLGEGGFGATYRISGVRGRPPAVLKLMPAGGLRARLSARLAREMGTIAALSHHRDMVTISGWGRSPDDRWYLLQEEAPGGSLADLLAAGHALEWRKVVRLGVRISRVLELAHGLGVVHRDIKPANVLLSASGQPMLSDLGLGTLACSFSLDTPAAAESLACAAPEAAHTMALTPASDVYALGATMRLLLGADAFGRGRREPPAGLLEVIETATAPGPADRYASAEAMRHDLELLDDRADRSLKISVAASRKVA
jgi:serine/threonine protein kinase